MGMGGQTAIRDWKHDVGHIIGAGSRQCRSLARVDHIVGWCKYGVQRAGAQAVFDVDTFKSFLAATAHLKTAILAGVVLLKSAAMARFMNRNIAGVSVPEPLIRGLEAAPDRAAFCIDTAARLIRDIKPLCQGVHIMPIGWADEVPLVLDAAGL